MEICCNNQQLKGTIHYYTRINPFHMFSITYWVLPLVWMVPFTENYLWLTKEHRTEEFFVYGGPVYASLSS